VSDESTALLMTKFYDGLVIEDLARLRLGPPRSMVGLVG
jgi:hypothetical protein